MNKRRVALITGATSGIGLELAKVFAKNKHNLLLTGRNIEALKKLALQWEQDYGIEVRCCSVDLSVSDAPEQLCGVIDAEMYEVDILVNNAGFGLRGKFSSLPLSDQLALLQVNIVALTHLTRLLVPTMVEQKRGKILNVASVAGFLPGPLMATYYASKAYVLYFSLALSEELRGTGVTVTTLCPGPTPTRFGERAGIAHSHLFQNMASTTAEEVATIGYREMMKGKQLVIPGTMNKLVPPLIRCFPRSLILRVVKLLHTIKR